MKQRKRIFLVSVLLFAICLSGCGISDITSLWSADANKAPEDTQAVLFESAQVNPVTGSLVSVNALEYVRLADYRNMVIQKPEADDAMVAEEIAARLREDAAAPKGKDAFIQEGDEAVINYFGMIGFETVDQSTANNYTLVVGSHEMASGFEEALLGMKAGETKKFEITYPENDSSMPELAGSTVTYQVTVQSFTRTPELSEEWAAEQGYGSLEEFRQAVISDLEAQIESEAIDYGEAFWKLVCENSSVIDYPEQDLLLGVEEYRQMTENYASYAQMDVASFLRSQNIDETKYQALAMEYARRLVKQNLIVQAILDTEGVDLYGTQADEVRDRFVKSYAVKDRAELEERFGSRQIDESVGLVLAKQILESL